MTTQPPTVAARLLRRLLPTQDHEVLLGDLAEEYQRGRSIVWYWSQILAAVVVGAFRDIRAHPLFAVRAIAVGLVSFEILIRVQLELQDIATGAGFMWGTTWIGLPFYWHWPYYGTWSFDAFLQLLWLTSSIAMGWIVARTHRGRGITMALAFVSGLIAFRIWNILSLPGPVIGLSLSMFVRYVSVEALAILLGGYLATPGEKHV